MTHRRNVQLSVIAICKNNIEGKCRFSEQMCWWSHEQKVAHEGNNKWYICDKNFHSKPALMSHKKNNHSDTVKICSLFKENKCRFVKEACWFKRCEEDEDDEENVEMDENDEIKDKENTNSVFQKV